MKVSELRIGNTLNFTAEFHSSDRTITIDDMKQFCQDEKWLAYFWKPIPLTEEWLLKFGFDTRHQTNLFMKTDNLGDFTFTFLKLDSGLIPGICHRMNIDNPLYMGPGNKKIKYVHQLQNLYFALTGEELTLK